MKPRDARNVMQSRVEPRDSLDLFCTPLWATRALCEHLKTQWGCLDEMTVWEPAVGLGHMARALSEYFHFVASSDIEDYGYNDWTSDFLKDDRFTQNKWDWIITNPPFNLAQEFVQHALKYAEIGCAFLVRTAFLEGSGRYKELFSRHRPHTFLQFTERVPMHKGRVLEKGSTATAYGWVIFTVKPVEFTRLEWIAPCRKKLERPGDYV